LVGKEYVNKGVRYLSCILTKLLAELKKKQAKELTPQGYLLLKENIEWVKGHN